MGKIGSTFRRFRNTGSQESSDNVDENELIHRSKDWEAARRKFGNERFQHRNRTNPNNVHLVTVKKLVDRTTASLGRRSTTPPVALDRHTTAPSSDVATKGDAGGKDARAEMDSKTATVALTATLGALGAVLILLVALIVYFGYFRRRKGSGERRNGMESGPTTGVPNFSYSNQSVSKRTKVDRLSIIPECSEDQEYEYIDSNHTSVVSSASGNVMSPAVEYEYVDSDHTSVVSSTHAHVPPGELEYEYVDPNKVRSVFPLRSEKPAEYTYQHMIHSGLDPHVYADGVQYQPTSDDNPPEYDSITNNDVVTAEQRVHNLKHQPC